MSLSITSNTSMVKIMKCLDNKSNRKTLHNLLKCSYNVKKVADENSFSKIPEAIVKILDERTSALDVSFGFDWANNKTTRRIGFANSKNHSKRMEKALLFLQSKAKSIKRLTIYTSTLDADILEVFRNNANLIRTISCLNLYDTSIEWTSDQFLQFMKLFDNLQTFSIQADLPVTCRITDEILSLVKTAVLIGSDYMEDHTPFPQITSNIFDFWIEKKTIKSIHFNILTEIPFSSVRKMIEYLSNNPKCGRIHFGTLKYLNDFYRELALFQKESGFNFSIEKSLRLCYVEITYKNSKVQFSFEVLCPMEMSFFETMLDDLRRLRVECEPFQNADLEIRWPFIIRFRKHVENLELYYFRFTKGITGTATVHGFTNEMMQEITTLEEEILVIIEKLKAEGMESDNLAQH